MSSLNRYFEIPGSMALIKEGTFTSRKNAIIDRLRSALVVKVGKMMADGPR